MTAVTISPSSSPSIQPRLELGGGSSSITPLATAGRIPQRDVSLAQNASSSHWRPDASILLVGIRGTGKTSLAILAATALDFRLVDADQNFHKVAGMSRSAYASRYGFDSYRKQELALMQSLLQDNPSRSIIVCGPGSAEGTQQELLHELKNAHPIIYVMRDPEEIDRYLQTNEPQKISRISQLITPSYRALSNFEFYNLSEPLAHQTRDPNSGLTPPSRPALVLKDVEHDFLHLIHTIRGEQSLPSVLQARHSLTFLSPEAKPFSYALVVPFGCVPNIASRLGLTDLVVDAIELVVDLGQLSPINQSFDHAAATLLTQHYYILRRNVRLPIIIHLHASIVQQAATRPDSDWLKYRDIMLHALRLGPEYMSLDLNCPPSIAQVILSQNVGTKVIGHYYDQNPEAAAWDSLHRRQLLETAESWGCDITRICQPATSRADNFDVRRFAYEASQSKNTTRPLICYNVGRMGRASCYINSVLTPVTHELITEVTSPFGDALLTVQAAQSTLYASFTLDPLFFGIYGSAVASALSPPMHNAAFKFCRMPHCYEIFESSTLRELESIAQNENFGGASISAPFKQEIISVLDYVSLEAQAIGAVNTLIPLRSRRLESLVERNRAGPVVALYGDNTDWIGIHTCIRQNLSPINAVKSRTVALVIGAGGMAHAAVYAAIRLGVHTIFVHNRTLENGEKLVHRFNGKSFSIQNIDLSHPSPSASPQLWPVSQSQACKTKPAIVRIIPSRDSPWPAGFDPPTIIVSCIARTGQGGQSPADNSLPRAWLASETGGVVIELAYNPIETPLVQQIRSLSRGDWISVHGLQVLPEQGIAQFELFTGRKAPENLMRAQVADYVKNLGKA
ncbi:uncharacterized protein E0L32_012416 [Thyridium curvatum]|uniref:Uncharacterized protein n=1 Tax=Thyridium curvatum TaxID=1093900 RepID=A0A507B0G9_9PEZI|nr:uncharacterized protein E0L32_012416 [Thyridium curvatum]TPX16595.1 hypothetical protein E0L32_012416 [Thyridium curvatum]